ncbi:MAG TPA: patatin-like phospholipase family protein [Steroidobacteraceae bacterium]|nr:patatin-like phospholipase family protein [Steroidobacteraceae bacterium]
MKTGKIRRIARYVAACIVAAFGGLYTWLIWTPAPPPTPEIPSVDSRAGGPNQGAFTPTFVPALGGNPYGACVRILAIEGGGVRGVIPAHILAMIEERTHKAISAQFDLIVGTSTGALLAFGLTRPSDPDVQKPAFGAHDIEKLYRDYGREVFPSSLGVLRSMRRIFRPKYLPTVLEMVLQQYFEDVELGEALTRVAVPAYEIEDHTRIWFDSYDSPYSSVYMRDIARGATAAPTYLPPVRIAVSRDISSKGYVVAVDGGLFANNPSLEALSRAHDLSLSGSGDDSVLLLSVGTGINFTKYSFDDVWRWGLASWIDPLLEIAFSDPAIDTQVRQIMKIRPQDHYIRLQVDFGNSALPLDDASAKTLAHFIDVTKSAMSTEQKLAEAVTQLSLPRSPQCERVGLDRQPRSGPRHPR